MLTLKMIQPHWPIQLLDGKRKMCHKISELGCDIYVMYGTDTGTVHYGDSYGVEILIKRVMVGQNVCKT